MQTSATSSCCALLRSEHPDTMHSVLNLLNTLLSCDARVRDALRAHRRLFVTLEELRGPLVPTAVEPLNHYLQMKHRVTSTICGGEPTAPRSACLSAHCSHSIVPHCLPSQPCPFRVVIVAVRSVLRSVGDSQPVGARACSCIPSNLHSCSTGGTSQQSRCRSSSKCLRAYRCRGADSCANHPRQSSPPICCTVESSQC